MRLNLVNTNKPIVLIEGKKKISARADKDGKNSFDVYNYYDEESRINFHIIPNKAPNGFLLPDFKHVDYLMLLKENIIINLDEIITKLRLSDQVLTAFPIKTEDVKSIENLLF